MDLRGVRQKISCNGKELYNKVYSQYKKDELKNHGGNVVK